MIISPAIKKTEINKSGKCNIKIRISHNYGTRFIATNYYIQPEFFSEGKINTKYSGYKFLQVQLDSKCLEYEQKLISINYRDMTINRIVEILTETTAPGDFIIYFKTVIAIKKKINERTGEIYQNTLTKIIKYELRRPILFQDITAGWLTRFDEEMKANGLLPNSISIHFRNIRAVFNHAIDNEVIPLEMFPFRRFKFKGAKTKKRALSIDQLIFIRDFETTIPMVAYARDIFMLSFYLIGTNLTDLYYMEIIKDGRAEFRRAKTHQPYSIKIEPEAQVIINRIKGDNTILNLSVRYQHTLRMIQQINRGLYQIIPNITSYWARHTWSTICSNELNAIDDQIGSALGHSKKTVTDTYINRNPELVDKLNRKVIDFLNKYKKMEEYIDFSI